MFVFNRSAFAVLAPLALLVAVVLWSNRATQPAAPPNAGIAGAGHQEADTRVAAR